MNSLSPQYLWKYVHSSAGLRRGRAPRTPPETRKGGKEGGRLPVAGSRQPQPPLLCSHPHRWMKTRAETRVSLWKKPTWSKPHCWPAQQCQPISPMGLLRNAGSWEPQTYWSESAFRWTPKEMFVHLVVWKLAVGCAYIPKTKHL